MKQCVKILLILIVVLVLSGCSSNPTKNNKYYIKPREEYTLKKKEFDVLDNDIKTEIALYLRDFVSWYNEIPINEDEIKVTISDLENLEAADHQQVIIDYVNKNLSNDDYCNAAMPSIDLFTTFWGVFHDKEVVTEVKADSTESSYSISLEEWMQVHDKLSETIEFYYGD